MTVGSKEGSEENERLGLMLGDEEKVGVKEGRSDGRVTIKDGLLLELGEFETELDGAEEVVGRSLCSIVGDADVVGPDDGTEDADTDGSDDGGLLNDGSADPAILGSLDLTNVGLILILGDEDVDTDGLELDVGSSDGLLVGLPVIVGNAVGSTDGT